METTEIHVNISSQTCRVCLEAHETNLCLNDEIEYNDVSMELWQLLESVSKVKYTWMDPNLPMRLCQNCTRRLISAYEFIVEVENAQVTLQSLYLQQEIDSKPEENNMEVVEPIEQGNTVAMEEFLPTSFEEQEGEEEPLFADEDHEKSNQLHLLPEEPENKELSHSRPSQLGSRLTHSENFIFKCAICPRVFAKSESLSRHFGHAHRLTADVAALKLANESSGTGLLTCEYCPREFKRQDTLRRHMQAFHPDAAALETEETPENAARKRIAKRRDCPYCGLSFPVSSLTIHIRRHTGDNPYKCDQCEKAFPRSQDLSLHMRQHTGERPSECKICSKKFISQNKLARHMRLHTGQRPYSCTRCNKSFVQSNDLKIHMRRHTGERPYQCGVCGESFLCGSHLNIHRNRKGHQETVIPGRGAEDTVTADPYINARVNKRRAEDIERMRLKRIPREQLDQEQEVDPNTEVPAMAYRCGVCEQNFKSGALLTIHRNKMSHYETGRVFEDPFGERQKKLEAQ
ncbi:LOW QUALITY PROTEIN: zinc finger protein 420 [Drosophila eugracilis]|uniref:LOW QUALITY PROTEIN: zinc finger protein 420 n=1 Tax=Drosophila eugracilis TaxID=29029 RepID=UPI001BDAF4E9|nr:LOW QUALITY PROTEIN: zinc finger protein 420 [Drosophila eugracilis]